MRRSLSLFVTGMLGISSMYAVDQVPVKKISENGVKEMQAASVVPVDLDVIKEQRFKSSLAKVRVNDDGTQKKATMTVVRSATATSAIATKAVSAALPAGIVGNKQFAGKEYFDKKNLVWDGFIEADAADETKIWIGDMFFKGELESPVKFYGIVDAAKKTITVPAGQILAYTQENQPVVLYGMTSDLKQAIGTGKNFVFTFDNEGKITVPYYLGTNVGQVSNGWYDLFNPGMTVTDLTKVPPVAVYSTPQGMLFQGWITDWNYFYSTYAYSPILENNVFANTSTTPSAKFDWKLDEVTSSSSTGDVLQTTHPTTKDLVFNSTPKTYRMPQLTAQMNGKDSVYCVGTPLEQGYSYYILSGDSYSKYEEQNGEVVQTKISGFTTANPQNDAAYYRIGNADVNGMTPYLYGTGISSNGAQQAVISRYEKPLSTLYFEGVDFFLGVFSAPAQTQFTCYIVRIEETGDKFKRLDTIATSVIHTEDVTMLGQGKLATMSFTDFTVMTDMGLPAAVSYLELDDPFIVELTGFQVPKCELAVMSERNNSPTSFNRSYFVINEEDGPNTYQYLEALAMLVNLRNAAYAYLIPENEDPTIRLDNQGSSISMKLYPYYLSIWADNEDDIPEWLSLSVDENANQTDGSLSIHVSATPLPANVEGRRFDLEMKTWGGKVTVPVVQGIVSGISEVAAISSKAVMVGDQIELTYQNMQSVTVTDVNGKIYATYPLAASGKTLIPAAELTKGVYMLQLKGETTEVIRIVK
ncbi:MAG: T9SS type A sorting domain-containing protein [Bacteroidales bacterium]